MTASRIIRAALAACVLVLCQASSAGRQAAPASSGRASTAVDAQADPMRALMIGPPPGALSEGPGKVLAEGIRLFREGRHAAALPLVSSPALATTLLADYGLYFTALSYAQTGALPKAAATLARLRERKPQGFLSEASLLAAADVAAASGDHVTALGWYSDALDRQPAAPDDVLMRLARSALAAGDNERAARAYARVWSEFPLAGTASAALAELKRLPAWQKLQYGSLRYQSELVRAERLFQARRPAQARAAFETVRPFATGDDAMLVALRLAECEFLQGRHGRARDHLKPLLRDPVRQAEARYYYISTIRALGEAAEAERLTRELVADPASGPWAEEALYGLASSYLTADDEARADTVYRELLERFPNGRFAERAVWRVGWRAYKLADYNETVRRFEAAVAAFPNSDFRPGYMYWSARALERLGAASAATAAYRAVIARYGNSYYGRQAALRLKGAAFQPAVELPASLTSAVAAAPDPPTRDLIAALISVGLFGEAVDELLYLQRTWGRSLVIDATLGWVYNRRGELRKGITSMKRAFPQYLAAGSERLPVEIRQVIFPMDHWPLIQRYAAARQLDPHLLAALIAQESTFEARARSSANARGVMQILPSTGRRYALKLGVRRYSVARLYEPEVSILIGSAYLADLIRKFGRTDLALAAYNAGENRVAAWLVGRRSLEPDEFVDDIPFPETQNYVRRILGTVDDYRALYPLTPADASSR